MIKDITTYFSRVIMSVNPVVQYYTALFSAIVGFVFPDEALIAPATAVGIVVVLDLLTKYYARAQKCRNGRNLLVGLFNAIKQGELRSATMFAGTIRKIISYLFIMIIVGLSYNFGAFQGLASAFSVFIYALMFLRESQSIVENLVEAGHTELKSVLKFIKKRREILGDDPEDDKPNKYK